MDKNQVEIWDALCNLDGETVARLFTNYYFMEDEGVI